MFFNSNNNADVFRIPTITYIFINSIKSAKFIKFPRDSNMLPGNAIKLKFASLLSFNFSNNYTGNLNQISIEDCLTWPNSPNLPVHDQQIVASATRLIHLHKLLCILFS